MRRIVKKDDSLIIKEKLQYLEGNPANNRRIKDYLLAENGQICCYTEEYFGPTDLPEIDHFNPSLKGTPGDSYHNWYLVKGKPNREKSNKWIKDQPILDPFAEDFENRILYNEGDYILENENDIAAKNLIDLLKLNKPDLASDRKKYIKRMQKQIDDSGISANDYFNILLDDYAGHVVFIRALKEEFGYIHPNY